MTVSDLQTSNVMDDESHPIYEVMQPIRLGGFTKAMTLVDKSNRPNYYGYLGDIIVPANSVVTNEATNETTNEATNDAQRFKTYLNTKNPFCALAIGVQGTGKSYSVSAIIENCMIDFKPCIECPSPISTLVLHYDQDIHNMCEAVSMTQLVPQVKNIHNVKGIKQITVLVSPNYYKMRQSAYKHIPNCVVLPLSFAWHELTANQILGLMHVDPSDNMPLYMTRLLVMLRDFQKNSKVVDFESFKRQLQALKFEGGQIGPLQQRLDVIECFLSRTNECDLQHIFEQGQLVLCDLTDPLLPKEEVNAIFNVLLEKYIGCKTPNASKMVVLDEAHKYLTEAMDPLSLSVIKAVRQMRHHGIRVVVSSQSPASIPSELIELSTLVMLHHFHVPDWFQYLKSRLPMNEKDFEKIRGLKTGEALVYTRQWPDGMDDGRPMKTMMIRNRLTKDSGRTVASQ